MCFALTLVSTFLLASAVPAVRSLAFPPSYDNITPKRSNNFAGAVLTPPNPAIYNVTGTITLPYVWGPVDSGVGFWFGLDDVASCGAEFAAGFKCTVTSNGPSYTAVAYSYNGAMYEFTNTELNYTVPVRVTLRMSNQTTGYAMFENLEGGSDDLMVGAMSFTFHTPICQRSAWWVVDEIEGRDRAYWGFVPFDQPMAYSQEEYTADNSSLYNITSDNGLPLTNVEIFENIIRITEQVDVF